MTDQCRHHQKKRAINLSDRYPAGNFLAKISPIEADFGDP